MSSKVNFLLRNKILEKIAVLDRKLNKVAKIEEHLERLVAKEEKEVLKIEKEEVKIEKALLRVGNLTIKKSHLLELARGTAGAFLGVGLGQALGGSVKMAQALPWLNIVGILVFIFLLVGVLIYKKEKDQVSRHPHGVLLYITKKLIMLYLIAILVQLLGLILFNNFPGWNETLLKALVVGSYSAMSSAVAFTLI